MYYPRLTKVIIHHFLIQEKTLSWRNKIGMHTSKDDYLINTLRFVSRKEASQIYGAVLPECLTSLEMKESKAYKTYLGYSTGSVPPKIARKFKKASPTKKDSDLVFVDKEPVQKGKRVKRSAKKPLTTPAAGIDLLYEVALAKKAQLKEVRKKSLRDFHKTHPSGSESWGNDEDDSNDEQESKDESSEHENESEEQESDDSEQEDESDNDNQEEEEVNQENESKDDDIESDEDKGMDDTTNQFDDDILPKEVSNFAPPVIEKLIKESRDEVTLAKVSSQPQSTYKAASTLTEFELKKILLDKMEKSESYLTSLEHRDVGQKNQDKDEDPFAGSDRGLKKRKTSKDAEPTTDSDMPQDQEGNLGDNEDEPRKETASRRDCSTSTDKSLKDFDELMSTPIDFSGYILNGLKIKNLTQEILLGPAFRLLKGTRSNYAELEYDFEECYKDLSEKLDWENPEGGDYPFDLSKPLQLITRGKRQRVPFE
ncbi:hypothetical protein Tco_0718046 [Tanacetum coccineum]